MAWSLSVKLENVCRALAGTVYRAGMPLSRVIKVMWTEYDRLYGWDLLTDEEKASLVEQSKEKASSLTPSLTPSSLEETFSSTAPPQPDDKVSQTPVSQISE